MRHAMRSILLLLGLCCLVVPSTSRAQSTPAPFRTRFPRELIDRKPVLVCTRVTVPPKIDGEVDRDPVWAACGRTGGAWVELGTKDVSARQTVVYACYDDEKIYLAFVCEEPELNRVRMDGNVRSLTSGRAGPDDSAEAIFEVGGLDGDGVTHAFRANSRARLATMGYSTPVYGWVPPEWESAGKFGPNRWMVEMAVRFDSLQSRRHPRGLKAPMRADVWGIKLVRHGGQQKSGEARMTSTFNVEIPYPLFYICGYNGLLYFEDSNVLRDGQFKAPLAQSAWKMTGKVAGGDGGVRLETGAGMVQAVTVRPASYYVLSVEASGPAGVLIDGRDVDGAPGGFWTGGDQVTVEVSVRARRPTTVKSVRMEYQPGEEPPGVWCLTNNYRRSERNIRSLLPEAPDGSYRYVKVDYAGRIEREDHPARIKWSWAYDPDRAVLDLGGTKGWIPFSRGSLTGKPVPVFWQTMNPEAGGWGRREHAVVDIDLGHEYFVRGLDVLWPAPYAKNIDIWCKGEGAKEWTFLYTGDGPFVDPEQRRGHDRGTIRVRGLDSVARYIRWRSTERHNAVPQMDGIQEMWVWGEPKGKHASTDVKPFQPWVSKELAPRRTPQTWTPDRASAQIVPMPRKMNRGEGWFVVTDATRIVFQDDPQAREVAGQIRDEIRERWKIDVHVVAESDAADVTDAVVYVGQPRLGGRAAQLAVSEALAVDADKPAPQGYGFTVTPGRIVVLGRDGEGLYWGVQSLMMAMRWRSAPEDEVSGPSVPAMKVLDWPGTAERAIYMHKGYTSILNVPQGETGRVMRLFHLLSRLKFNVVYVNTHHGDGGEWAYAAYGWKKGTLASVCREIRRKYHVEIRPIMPPSEGMSRDWWKDIIEAAGDWGMGESDPDESAPELGGHVNICPLHPRTLPMVLDKMDRTIEEYGYPGTVWLWDQAYISPDGGGRWAQCRRCRTSGKTPEEIYAWFLRGIVEHLDARQVKARFKSGWLRYGERSPKERRKVALDVTLLPETMRIDLDGSSPAGGAAKSAWAEEIRKTLRPERTSNGPTGWPSVERVFRGPWTETEVLHSLTGGGITWGGGRDTGAPPAGNLGEACEDLWYAPQVRPRRGPDVADLSVWVNAWWYGVEFPAWRNGEPPRFYPLDLRPFANHVSHATGVETLKPGHPPEFDLRYMEPGVHTLGGVDFDIIDPGANGGKGVLMMGRAPSYCPPDVAASIIEDAGPIPVGRKLASIAFLRARWECVTSGGDWRQKWLRPTCRVVYDDDTWLVADAFSFPHEGHATSNWSGNWGGDLYYRTGWQGNTPTGQSACLGVAEWVNPYPEKTIKFLDIFTPDMEDGFSKRVNTMCEAFVAITGVETTPHDVAFWSGRGRRPPLLGPRRERPADLVEMKVPRPEGRLSREGTWRNRLDAPGGPVNYTGTLIGPRGRDERGTSLQAMGRHEGVRHQGFEPFGATLTFDEPARVARVELIGPTHDWGSLGSYSLRRQKVDVTVEISRDGETWERAGELRGISAQADFLPVELPDTPVKAIRMTASAAPYSLYYHPTNFWGGMFNRPGSRPHFAWRLFARADAKAQVKR